MGLFIYCVTMATLVVQVTAQPDGQPAVIVNSKFAVDEHNKIRKLYDYTNNELLNQGPLAVNLKLAKDAKDCIDLMFQNIEKPEWQSKYHPCNPSKKSQGENIFTSFSSARPDKLEVNNDETKTYVGWAIEAWAEEVKFIDYSKGKPLWALLLRTDDPNKPIGHFTQVVWKSTKNVGCAIGSKHYGGKWRVLVLCRYSPAGNQFTTAKLIANVPFVDPNKKVCKDKNAECGDLLSYEGVTCAIDMIKQICQKTCGFC